MSNVIPTRLGRVEYAEEGTAGPVVLAIHGAMGGFDQGLILARAAFGALPHRAVAPSRPGYLRTPMQNGRTPEQQADLHAALLDALGHDSAVVIAVSGGGQSAVQFALRHPARCCLRSNSAQWTRWPRVCRERRTTSHNRVLPSPTPWSRSPRQP